MKRMHLKATTVIYSGGVKPLYCIDIFKVFFHKNFESASKIAVRLSSVFIVIRKRRPSK